MKSRILTLTIIATLATSPAYAADAEAQPSTFAATIWAMRLKVETKVTEWWNYWTAAPKVATSQAQPQSSPSTGAQPQATPSTVAPQAVPTEPKNIAVAAPAKGTIPTKQEPEANKVFRQQPLFESKEKSASLQEVRQIRDSVKAGNVLKVAQPGRTGTSKLAKSKEGVPVTDWSKLKVTKSVPRLDIGTENLISREDFSIDKLSWGMQKPSEFKRLPTPNAISDKELKGALGVAVSKVLGVRGLQANFRTVGQPVSKESVDKIQYTLKEVVDFKPLSYQPLPEETLKMVAALILFEKGNSCHIVMGLFNNLAEAPKTKMEATYHLGACAHQLKMHQSAFDKLSQVVAAEDKDFGSQALTLLSKDLPLIYEQPFYKLIKGVKSFKNLVTPENQDNVSYRMAKGAYRAGDFKTSINYADRVDSGSDLKNDARFLSAMNSFALGDKAASLKKLEDLWASLESRKVTDSNIRALVSVNLARMNFAQKKYTQALQHYMQVPKDHALWVQALIEQGWTQLATEDYSGAIGNMYSLHSPYFKAVYQPESFVVRTIGYLNICQYGDAYKTLTWLEKDYRDWDSKLTSYMSTRSQPVTIYNTVKNYVRGKSTDDVEGVPHQIWREMARRRDFLNLQLALNDKQDEAKRYEGVNEKIKTEKASIRNRADQSKKRFDSLRAVLTKAKADQASDRSLEDKRNSLKAERDLTIALRFQLAILEQSRQGYLTYQRTSQAKLDTETIGLTTKAGEILLTRAKSMQTDMKRVLENNEFLRYEVFSGSGENIRYQVAGGDVGNMNRVPAHIRPTKMMNWSFDGEYWVDEIGSYRSSLQNVCPTQQGRREMQEGDHAALESK